MNGQAVKVHLSLKNSRQNSTQVSGGVVTEHAGPAFEEFLQCIGEKVKLQGFDKYRGGLDCKSECCHLLCLNRDLTVSNLVRK